MKMVIDIDEELYNYMRAEEYDRLLDKRFDYQIRIAVANGTPLPKGHGNLFDENDFEKCIAIMTESMDLGYGEIMDIIDEIPTIIEADTESEE